MFANYPLFLVACVLLVLTRRVQVKQLPPLDRAKKQPLGIPDENAHD